MMRMAFFLLLSLMGLQAQALQSGIDSGGYRYVDSDEASFDYDFEDIIADPNSTALSLWDDQSRTIDIGFALDFYGVIYSSVNVSSNGFLSFTSANHGCCQGKQIPSSRSVSNMGAGIAAWWEDLNPGNGGSVHYQTSGIAPDRQLIVQFTEVPTYGSSNTVNTFQYKLFEADQRVEVHYQALYGDSGNYSVGIQKDALTGLQRYFGPGGGQQNQVPAFDLPYAIRYSRAGVGHKHADSAPTQTLEPGTANAVSIELFNHNAQDEVLSIEYLGADSDINVSGPSALSIAANGQQDLVINLSSEPDAYGRHPIIVRISSTGQSFESFDIPLVIFVTKLEQLSFSAHNPSYKPALSGDGQRLVLLSRDDLANNQKPSTTSDVFFYDVKNKAYRQLTHNPVGRNCFNVAISGNGQRVAAICNSSLDPNRPNQDQSNEIYWFDLEQSTNSSQPTQIAAHMQASTGSEDLALDHTGSTLAFISSSNLTGNNSDGSLEAYAYRLEPEKFIQLSQFDYGSEVASIDLDFNGQRFVTSSKSNVLTKNPNFKWQLFSGEVDHGVRDQLTDSNNYDSGLPKLSANGLWVTYSSRLVQSPSNSGVGNIFVTDFHGKTTERITHSAQFDSGYSNISADGSRILFLSQGSFDGANAAANTEVFVYDRVQQSSRQYTEINSSKEVQYVAFSFDGGSIAYSGEGDWVTGSNPGAISQLFLLSGLARNLVQGHKTAEQNPLPIFSPIGNGEQKEETKTLKNAVNKTPLAGAFLHWLTLFAIFPLYFRTNLRANLISNFRNKNQ